MTVRSRSGSSPSRVPWPMRALHEWLAATFLSASLPSSADWKIARPALVLLALLGGGLWFVTRSLAQAPP